MKSEATHLQSRTFVLLCLGLGFGVCCLGPRNLSVWVQNPTVETKTLSALPHIFISIKSEAPRLQTRTFVLLCLGLGFGVCCLGPRNLSVWVQNPTVETKTLSALPHIFISIKSEAPRLQTRTLFFALARFWVWRLSSRVSETERMG